MRPWDEWFAYLDGRLEACIGSPLPDIHELLLTTEQRRAETGLSSMGPRARVLDELGMTACFASQLEETARESHYRAASQLFAQGRGTAWLPAVLPNSEDSRVARRVVAAAASRSTAPQAVRRKLS